MTDNIASLQKLRAPFEPHQISYLPKGGVKLAYVGHAALTDRLLSVDPLWTWEPVANDSRGLPLLDESGGLWIRLTICGVTRLGYGDAGDKKGCNAMKERIGDALRNAAMRFGAALDLWHKGELHIEDAPVVSDKQAADIDALISEVGADKVAFLAWVAQMAGHEVKAVSEIPEAAVTKVVATLEKKRKPQKEPS